MQTSRVHALAGASRGPSPTAAIGHALSACPTISSLEKEKNEFRNMIWMTLYKCISLQALNPHSGYKKVCGNILLVKTRPKPNLCQNYKNKEDHESLGATSLQFDSPYLNACMATCDLAWWSRGPGYLPLLNSTSPLGSYIKSGGLKAQGVELILRLVCLQL
jgi:hypothetical protein